MTLLCMLLILTSKKIPQNLYDAYYFWLRISNYSVPCHIAERYNRLKNEQAQVDIFFAAQADTPMTMAVLWNSMTIRMQERPN